jgi:hypothetical protein
VVALGCFALGRPGLLQPSCALGLHVDFGHLHIRRTEVADLVECSKSYSPPGLVRHRVSVGLAGDGMQKLFYVLPAAFPGRAFENGCVQYL